jgi:hypothetical protein
MHFQGFLDLRLQGFQEASKEISEISEISETLRLRVQGSRVP